MFRSASVAFWVVTLLLCCAWAQAAGTNAKDPIIIIAGGGDVASSSDGFPLGSVFSILSPTGTSPLSLLGGSACNVLGIELPLCLFSNGTDFTWTSVTFSVTPGLQPPGLICLALGYFSQCKFTDNNHQVVFSGGSGLPSGDIFLFAVVGWDLNTTFAGQAAGSESSSGTVWRPLLPGTAAPHSEPSTAELFLNGHVALRDRSRLRAVAESAA